jgi:hypothetical protein
MSFKSAIHNPNVKRSELKRLQHHEHEQAVHKSRFHSTFTFEQVTHLATLAYEGITPDGTYSDDECSLWSELRREFHRWY